MGSKGAMIALLIGVGCSSISSLIASGAGGYVWSSSSNCSIQWSNTCVNGSETGNVTAEKYFGSNCATVYPSATLSADGKTASRTCTAGTSVTISGETFDPTGYTVSRGYIWNRQPLTGYTASVSTDTAACRQRCQDNNNCLHFARRVSDGMCYLNETSSATADNAHVRAIKNSGTNKWASSVNLSPYSDVTSSTLNNCKSNCTSNSSCSAWYYRNSTHSDPNLRNTCSLWRNGPSTDKYDEGFMGR
jgi:hypothetical protein